MQTTSGKLPRRPKSPNSKKLCDDFRRDLEAALAGDFDFEGKFAFGVALPNAPNPCISIEGVGTVGLPLSEIDAKRIKQIAKQAPFGHGEKTVVDTKVRHTWEVEPPRILFRNPAWQRYVENTVVSNACAELGVVGSNSPPRCELYKLLLYEEGSLFLPHQDTEKTSGMFATIIIVLPSSYSGGQIHVSHAAKRDIFDYSSISDHTTTLLGWYTDVVHEVKPITSGFRLALSYNLIHTSRGIPRPVLPSMHAAMAGLRSVLEKWVEGTYVTSSDMIAYLLEHEYSQHNLEMGATKGHDSHKLSHLKEVADALGLALGLANLKHFLSGAADDDGPRHKRGRWDSYEEEEDDGELPGFLEVYESKYELTSLVDLDGHPLFGVNEILLDEDDIIPKDAFKDEGPDDHEYEGYMGNGAGTLEYWYQRTVVILYQKDKERDIRLSLEGAEYAISILKADESAEPTAESRTLADAILTSLALKPPTVVVLKGLVDVAISWGDRNMWTEIIKYGGVAQTPRILEDERLAAVWKTFSFEAVRPMFESGLASLGHVGERVALVERLASLAPPSDRDSDVTRWKEGQTTLALQSLKSASKADVPILMYIARIRGVQALKDVVVPQLQKMSLIYEFWTHFIAALQRPENVQTLTNSEESLAAYKSLLDSSFHSIILQWNATVAQPQHHDYYGYPGYPSRPNNSLETTSISRVTELVKLCLSSGRLIECGKLFDSILKTQMPGRLDTFFVPLVTELYKTFARHGLKPTSQPFNDFLRRLVELYLRNVLGAKPSVMRQPPSTRVGCGCQECNALDQFISSTESEKIFRYVQARRTHLQKRLQNVPSLCTFKTIPQGSPRGLQVTKDPKIVEAYRWKERQAAAAKFLVDLNKDVVKEVMGPRYIDVQSAIEGSQPFVLSATLGAQVAPSEAPSQTLGAVAGQKRKKAKSPPADSDVIDLT